MRGALFHRFIYSEYTCQTGEAEACLEQVCRPPGLAARNARLWSPTPILAALKDHSLAERSQDSNPTAHSCSYQPAPHRVVWLANECFVLTPAFRYFACCGSHS